MIFLGDVGSGALGFCATVGGLLAIHDGLGDMVTVFLPLYPIFLDASTTIGRRFLRGQRITSPHRMHLYQRMAVGGLGHARVTAAYGLVAGIGVTVVLLRGGSLWVAALAAYFIVVLIVGLTLDQRFPV